jgi:hypothetical protein
MKCMKFQQIMKGRNIIFGLVGAIILSFTNTAFAHEYEVHPPTDPLQWITGGLMMISILITISIWGRLIYFAFRKKDHRAFLRSSAVLIAFVLWFALIATQHWLLSRENNFLIYFVSMGFSYLVLPLALIALWRVVLLHTRSHLRHILKWSGYRMLLIVAVIAYGIFYLFGSGLVSPPDLEDPPPPPNGFIASYESYGPLTVWPNVEFCGRLSTYMESYHWVLL